MAFGRVIRGSTNCVGHMLMLGELARDDVLSNNAVNNNKHWMNELELPRIGPFGVDNWTQVPPFSFTGDVERGILSLAEVNDLLEERSGGPSTEELFDPAIRHSALPICNADDWQYAVTSSRGIGRMSATSVVA